MNVSLAQTSNSTYVVEGLNKKLEECGLAFSTVRDGKEGAAAAPSVQEYLETTVMGTLTEGLEELCRQRPANPVDHLALFLLRRSHSSATVEVSDKEAVPVEPPKRT